MKLYYTGLLAGILCLSLLSCSQKQDETAKLPTISPGVAQSWDIGNHLLKRPLPAGTEDGFLSLKDAPEMTIGLLLASEKITPRLHEVHDLTLYCHRGSARIHAGEVSKTVNTGDAIYIPRGTVYSMEATTPGQLEFFAVYTPRYKESDLVYMDNK